jgi:hypothetical protein
MQIMSLRLALLFTTLTCALLGSTLRADERPVSADEAVFFEKQIRPVLAEQCFACHGEKKQEGGLRLDTRANLIKGSDGGPVVVPGKPADSTLIDAVRHIGDLKMPPAPKEKLPPDAIAALVRWVEIGLPWPDANGAAQTASKDYRTHWAFQPITSPTVPKIQDSSWIHTGIDRFVLAKLEAAGLAPAPPADRRTLLRRATFDLIGLPPSPAETAAFEEDPRPTRDAFAAVVERLLASPHYGERWARHWLDVARYADNKGYVFFEEQSYPWAYAYRDWVIRAFNEDLPYDQFVLQQLAADQLPLGRDQRPLAALGFLTVGGHFMNNVHDIFDDRIDVVARGFLGLTVTCARCHDHKYDPIPQSDYYALYGVFRSSSEPTVPPAFDSVPETEGYEYYELELAGRRLKLDRFLDRKHAELVASGRTRVAEYLLAAHASRDQPSTEDFMLLIPEGDLHPLVVQRYWLYLQRTRKSHDPVWAPWHALAAIPAEEFAAQVAKVLEDLSRQTDPSRPINARVIQALTEKPPQTMKDVAARYGELLAGIDKQWREALQAASDGQMPLPAGLAEPIAEQLRQVLYAADAPANVPKVAGWGVLTLLPDRAAQAEFQKLVKDLESWMIHAPHAPPRAMTLVDDPEPYNPRIFLRGNPNRAGNAIPRQFLGFLSEKAEPFRHGSGRLDLARAIVDRSNPLTSRVIVNRVWQHHFGTGLVRTPSDFGVRTEAPSHPELLDELASQFMNEGWSIKKLHRRIMESAVYQQISDSGRIHPISEIPPPKPSALDPDNRLLSRMPRRRLDFESLRDSLLSVAGALELKVGGPSVNLLAGSNRRSVYGFIDRLALPGLLRTFDFPSPDTSSAQRDQTTVAPQALYLLNGPFTLDCARKVLARPEIIGEQDFARRINLLHRLLFSRSAGDDDLDLAEEFFGNDSTARASAEAWQRYIHALLLTNEFAFVD